VDSGNTTIVDIRAKARRLKSQHNLGLLIIDYLQLMSSHQRVESRQQEVAEISRSLKLLAKELDIPVIGVSQLNRDPERRVDKRPQLADLRECVTGDTLVALADGRRVPIRDLQGTTPMVLAVSKDGRITEARSDKVWRVGKRPVLRVRLASGREIRATGQHRLLGTSGWVRVDDLSAGDRLAIARRLPEPANTIAWPEDRVALLGHLIGGGSYLDNAPMRYTTASDENSEMVRGAASREFDAKVTRDRGRGKRHQLLISGNGNRWHPAGVNRWLRELGVFGQRSHEKRIPREAFRLKTEQIGLLLRHLWATDGSIVVGSRFGPSNIFFSTSSRGLADDVASLLLRLGIVSRTNEVRQGSYRPWYMVRVSGTDSQRRFLGTVEAFGPRRRQAERLRARLGDVRPKTDLLREEARSRVSALMRQGGFTGRQTPAARGLDERGATRTFRPVPSRPLAVEERQPSNGPDIRVNATSDLFWDRVTAISSDGEEEVFDLTVPGPASWLADSIASHNSGALEMDADVVVFIHREDMYNDDPSVKGLAEAIVAKHRNGPTAKIKMTFLPHITQFADYAAAP